MKSSTILLVYKDIKLLPHLETEGNTNETVLSFIYFLWKLRTSLVAQLVKNLPAMQETVV